MTINEEHQAERDYTIAALTRRLNRRDKKRLPTIPIGSRVDVRNMGVGTVVGADGVGFDGVVVIFDPPAPRGFEDGCCAGVDECEVLSAPPTCSRCGELLVWDEGNGGQWIGAFPPRDWMTCHGRPDGKRHEVRYPPEVSQ